MLKKLLTACAAALLCSTASAGYIQYQLQDVALDSGGYVNGFFVQSTDDKSIAYYSLTLGTGSHEFRFSPSGYFDNIRSAQSNFYGMGPTSFNIYDDLSDAYFAELDLTFSLDNGKFVAGGWGSATPYWWMHEYGGQYNFQRVVSGTAVQVAINPGLAASLEAGHTDGLNHIVPRPLPEPGSLALLAIGALGAAQLQRRSRAPRTRPIFRHASN